MNASAAPVHRGRAVGLNWTYGRSVYLVVRWPAASPQPPKSPSKSILLFFAAAAVVLACFLVLPRDAGMVVAVAALIVVLGFVTYGAFSDRLVAPH